MFTTQYIETINPAQPQGGSVYYVSWVASPSLPAGAPFQVYVGTDLVYHGLKAWCLVSVPPGQTERVIIGSVAPTDDPSQSFAADLPAAPLRQVALSWTGGTSESQEIAGFYVYQSPSAGAPISYGQPVATIAAFPGGNPVAVASYGWTSGALTSGVWSFAVVAYDSAGNLSSPQTLTESISVPPLPPALFPDNTRLHYIILDGGEAPGTLPRVELLWNPSPG